MHVGVAVGIRVLRPTPDAPGNYAKLPPSSVAPS